MIKILGFYLNGTKGLSVLISPNNVWPLVYLRKPKHLTEEQFKIVCEGLSYSISKEAVSLLENSEGGFGA